MKKIVLYTSLELPMIFSMSDGCKGAGGGTKLLVPNFLSRAYCYEP